MKQSKLLRKAINKTISLYERQSRRFFERSIGGIGYRKVKALKPNFKWVADITEFKTPVGKLYLSIILDCFDSMPIAWQIGRSSNARLANRTLELAAK